MCPKSSRPLDSKLLHPTPQSARNTLLCSTLRYVPRGGETEPLWTTGLACRLNKARTQCGKHTTYTSRNAKGSSPFSKWRWTSAVALWIAKGVARFTTRRCSMVCRCPSSPSHECDEGDKYACLTEGSRFGSPEISCCPQNMITRANDVHRQHLSLSTNVRASLWILKPSGILGLPTLVTSKLSSMWLHF